MHLRCAILIVALAPACKSGDSNQLQPCGPGDTCPSGYVCHPSDELCYQQGVTGADASLTDAAPPDVFVPPPVTVTVYDSTGTPIPGMPVLFADSGGATVAVVMTDSAGVASHDLPGGGAITAGAAEDPNYDLTTILGAQPGDHLVVGTPPFSNVTLFGDATVHLVGPYTGATGYGVDAVCNGGATLDPSMAVTVGGLTSRCVDIGKADFLGNAADNSGVTAFAFAKGITLAASPTTTSVDLSGWTAAADETVTFSSAPALDGANSIDITVKPRLAASGLYFSPASEQTYNYTTGVIPAMHFLVPSGFADQAELSVQLSWFIPGQRSQSTRVVRAAGFSVTPPAVDAAAFLPRLKALAMDTADPARPVLSWTSTNPAASLQGGIVSMSWTEMTSSETFKYHSWRIVFPPSVVTAGTVTAPALPAELLQFRPSASSQSLVVNSVSTADVSYVPGGYDGFRAAYHLIFPAGGQGALPEPPSTAASTVRISTFFYVAE